MQQLILDVARIVVALVGAVAATYQVVVFRQARAPGQRWRAVTILGALAMLSAARLTHLGQPMTWEFVAATLVIVAGAVGAWLYRDELPAQLRSDTQHSRRGR